MPKLTPIEIGLFIVLTLWLAGCGHYQPPGDDLWLGVREMDRRRG